MSPISNKVASLASRLWVVIPTYWGPANNAIYDHPTPLDGQSTLPRLLESLAKLERGDDFTVLVLVSAVEADCVQAATAAVRRLMFPFQEKLNLFLIDAHSIRVLDMYLTGQGFDTQIGGMRGYANVRNCQLLIPTVFGAEVIVALDDDEVVNPDYLNQATKWIDKTIDDQRILGIAGPYLDAAGSAYLNEPEKRHNNLTDKAIFMNQTMRQLLAKRGSPNPTPMAFGGNMVFHRDMFTRIGFDPSITRGEDIDYVINAKMAGIQYFFDAQMVITHLPPRQYEAPIYGKLRQDIFRFMYEREKVLLGGLSADVFAPYPGCLIGDDLEGEARKALATAVTPDVSARFGTPQEIITSAQQYAQTYAPRYFQFARQWEEIVPTLVGNGKLAIQLLENQPEQ